MSKIQAAAESYFTEYLAAEKEGIKDFGSIGNCTKESWSVRKILKKLNVAKLCEGTFVQHKA
jgi:hypothetical protein